MGQVMGSTKCSIIGPVLGPIIVSVIGLVMGVSYISWKIGDDFSPWQSQHNWPSTRNTKIKRKIHIERKKHCDILGDPLGWQFRAGGGAIDINNFKADYSGIKSKWGLYIVMPHLDTKN